MHGLLGIERVRSTYADRVREARGNGRLARSPETTDELVIRRSAERDARRLARLAELDSGLVPAGPALVAELNGVLVAAVPLHAGGRPLADPFVPSAALVEMLELRRSQLHAAA
jgi:hypothetical protein